MVRVETVGGLDQHKLECRDAHQDASNALGKRWHEHQLHSKPPSGPGNRLPVRDCVFHTVMPSCQLPAAVHTLL